MKLNERFSAGKPGHGGVAGRPAQLIDEARRRVATAVNSAQTMLYWSVGACIRQDVLPNERADYDRDVASAETQLDEATFAALAEEQAVTLEQVIAEALTERAA